VIAPSAHCQPRGYWAAARPRGNAFAFAGAGDVRTAARVLASFGTGTETDAFGSMDQPDDRLPQFTQRRKMAPGSHHIP
jgi:hypothetical protein